MNEEEIKAQRLKHMKLAHQHQANSAFLLEVFGEDLAKKKGWSHIDGMGAIHLHLVHKHNWLPRDVRSMTIDDLLFALHEEMQGWTAPKDLP